MIPATQIKVGQVILFNGEPCRVVKTLHITPGNWRGMVQMKLASVRTGQGLRAPLPLGGQDRARGSGRAHPQVPLPSGKRVSVHEQRDLRDDDAGPGDLGDTAYYILEDSEVTVLYFEGKPVSIEVPNFVVLTVTECDPSLRAPRSAPRPSRRRSRPGSP